jgi:hypothetical protein
MSVNDWLNALPRLTRAQLALEPEITAAQIKKQEALSASELQLNQQYMPQFTALFGQQLQAANPQLMPTYNMLGERVRGDLALGYDLGEGLSGEIEQSIRGGQAARGNILGAAPTAQEAFGTGQAALALYNQRTTAAQNFLQGRQPSELWGSLQMARPNLAYPSQNYIGQSAGMVQNIQGAQSAYNATGEAAFANYNQALGNYNQALLGQASMQNQYAFEGYDRTLDQWMYKEAVKRGLYSTPSFGGGGGGMGGIGGSLISGIGGGLSTGIGLAASGASIAGLGVGGTALAGGAAAAISAAGAAICWLARRCIPNHWRQWRAWLFTQAPEELRVWYIYNGKRLASKLDDTSADVLGRRMLKFVT